MRVGSRPSAVMYPAILKNRPKEEDYSTLAFFIAGFSRSKNADILAFVYLCFAFSDQLWSESSFQAFKIRKH